MIWVVGKLRLFSDILFPSIQSTVCPVQELTRPSSESTHDAWCKGLHTWQLRTGGAVPSLPCQHT